MTVVYRQTRSKRSRRALPWGVQLRGVTCFGVRVCIHTWETLDMTVVYRQTRSKHSRHALPWGAQLRGIHTHLGGVGHDGGAQVDAVEAQRGRATTCFGVRVCIHTWETLDTMVVYR